MADYHLAQLNIARAVAPMEHEAMSDFYSNLEAINGLGERSPGFVWRLKDDSGNATAFKVSDDPLVFVNLTVWESIEDLYAYVYRTDHTAFFKRRFEWFERWKGPSVVLWWQPANALPTLEVAMRRLELLAANGPTAEAFTFKQRFDPPGVTDQLETQTAAIPAG
jgi:hypothetical protein